MQRWTLADCLAAKMANEYLVRKKLKYGDQWLKFKHDIDYGQTEVWHEVHRAVEAMPGGRDNAENASASKRAHAMELAEKILNESN